VNRTVAHCYRKIAVFIWLALLCILPFTQMVMAQGNGAQRLLKPGKFVLELVDIQNVDNIIPPVTSDEGIVRVVLDPSVQRYFSAEDVLNWFRNEQMRIQNIRFDSRNVSIRPDGSISFRFIFLFIPNITRIDRHIQIRNVKDFDIYYQVHELHQQKMVTYRLKVSEEPVYDTPRTGRLSFEANHPGFTVEFLDMNNLVRRHPVIGNRDTISFAPGTYIISVFKEGYREIILNQDVKADSLYSFPIVFRPIEVASIPQIVPARRNRWWLWTLVGIAGTSTTAWFMLRPDAQLPGPPSPPSN
jgi:hypothetical protein